jgi:Mg2+ and Co2+ transporter CorA
MNVILPIQDNPYAFLIIISFSLLLSIFAIVFFIKKKWLVP